jgi:hypothetical protein
VKQININGENKKMLNLNLTEVRETITVKPNGEVIIDYFFDFADKSYGMLSAIASGQTATFRRVSARA